jgi:hypothetical protein
MRGRACAKRGVGVSVNRLPEDFGDSEGKRKANDADASQQVG